jgi:hypothetical protein
MAPRLLHYQQKGQNLIIEDGNQRNHLESYDADGSIWFEDTLLFATISRE